MPIFETMTCAVRSLTSRMVRKSRTAWREGSKSAVHLGIDFRNGGVECINVA